MAIPSDQAVLSTRGPVLLVLALVVIGCAAPRQHVKPGSGSDSHRVLRTAEIDSAALPARQRLLEMWARAYFPGRTGQLLIVPREGDFFTRPDPNYTYMHGSPWPYDRSEERRVGKECCR